MIFVIFFIYLKDLIKDHFVLKLTYYVMQMEGGDRRFVLSEQILLQMEGEGRENKMIIFALRNK